MVAAEDAERPPVAVPLERSQIHLARLGDLLFVVAEYFEKRTQEDGPRVFQIQARAAEQFDQIRLEVRRLLPQVIEPPDRLAHDAGLVMSQPELEVLREAGGREVRRGDERSTGVIVDAKKISLAVRRQAVVRELTRARVAFRDVSRATDSRTVRACLVPPRVLLTHKAPYLACVGGDERAQAAALALLNSLPFDWQARRYVETNLIYYLLESLDVPRLSTDDYAAIARGAARLASAGAQGRGDERFRDFTVATGIASASTKSLSGAERQWLRIEIDARVARAWDLDLDDLEVLLSDFSERAVPPAYRRALRSRLRELREEADTRSSSGSS